jgi:hypothetical protein
MGYPSIRPSFRSSANSFVTCTCSIHSAPHFTSSFQERYYRTSIGCDVVSDCTSFAYCQSIRIATLDIYNSPQREKLTAYLMSVPFGGPSCKPLVLAIVQFSFSNELRVQPTSPNQFDALYPRGFMPIRICIKAVYGTLGLNVRALRLPCNIPYLAKYTCQCARFGPPLD